jgi:ABC-type transport system substrate-binding protein
VGCQEEAAGPPPPQPTVGPGGIPSIPSGLYFTPTPAPEGSRGGMIRFFGYDALVFDTLDPHQTQFGPTYNGHSSVFSKILMYLSHDTLEKAPDLAQSMPEVVDEVTYVVKLRPGVKFPRHA